MLSFSHTTMVAPSVVEALNEQCILTLSFIAAQTSLFELLMILGVVNTAAHI